jgi:hypothetical protein
MARCRREEKTALRCGLKLLIESELFIKAGTGFTHEWFYEETMKLP